MTAPTVDLTFEDFVIVRDHLVVNHLLRVFNAPSNGLRFESTSVSATVTLRIDNPFLIKLTASAGGLSVKLTTIKDETATLKSWTLGETGQDFGVADVEKLTQSIIDETTARIIAAA